MDNSRKNQNKSDCTECYIKSTKFQKHFSFPILETEHLELWLNPRCSVLTGIVLYSHKDNGQSVDLFKEAGAGRSNQGKGNAAHDRILSVVEVRSVRSGQ